jgi:sucrose phosphorylase
VNREKLQIEKIIPELNDPESFRSRVFFPYLNLIKTRKKQRAFHPNAGFEILQIDPKVFGIKRYSENQTIYALTNISSETISVSLSQTASTDQTTDLITGEMLNTAALNLDPYQYVWLEEKS